MQCSWWPVSVAALALSALSGCAGDDTKPAREPPAVVLSELHVVEVTTLTTVQGSSGIFLSPRPQQERPAYVEQGTFENAGQAPSATVDRAKVDTSLLFRGPAGQSVRFEAQVLGVEAQHFFPAVIGERWPLVLGGAVANASEETWGEWEGWRAYAGLGVEGAPAATLDYELGLESPLVLSAEGDELVVTNRSEQTVTRALLIYSHTGGVGFKEVGSLGPGLSRFTTTGPKEHPPEVLLGLAREQLEGFFSTETEPELAQALARAKSIPFLETLGLRLIYVLDAAQAPRSVELPSGIAPPHRFVLGQAEVLLPDEEQHVVSLLQQNALAAANVRRELGRFSHAKLEAASLSDVSVKARAEALLETLAE